MSKIDFAVGIGGAAGQGIATPGEILGRIFSRRGYYTSVYNSHQSIIRGGHCLLVLRATEKRTSNMGDKLDALLPFNQDTIHRHLKHLHSGGACIYDADKLKAENPPAGVQLCPLPFKQLAHAAESKNPITQNSLTAAALLQMIGVEFAALEEFLKRQFAKKGEAIIVENVRVARAGYDYAAAHFKPFPVVFKDTGKQLAFVEGNQALAMGGVAAGVKFYCAYPMSPSTGVLHYIAPRARKLGIMVRQIEDEIGVINMVIGAAHAGCRALCATSGGGFALMSEALGSAAMMEIPVVCINVQRAGPATGVPTKTEQCDLWQMLGAGQGDYPRVICAPTNIPDCMNTIPEIFNLADKFQCPGIVLSDQMLSEGFDSMEEGEFNFQPEIDRGKVIGLNGSAPQMEHGKYLRYKITDNGISPRALPGTPGYTHVVATDDHDENGVLISDEFTHPHKRRAMHEKRMRKMNGVLPLIAPPKLFGPANAQVTLVGWGSTEGVIREACEKLAGEEGIVANNLQIKWIVPLHTKEIMDVLSKARKVIIVENNFSGQFARYLRSETGFAAQGHIRKYDGEPFLPGQIVEGVKQILAGKTDPYVPVHPYIV